MMKTLYLGLLMGLIMPTLAFAGGSGYIAPVTTCSGVFNISTLQTSRLAGVTTVEMRHISDLTRTEQQQLADQKGSASLEAEFHRGNDNCWYMLLKTMSSGKTRTASAVLPNTPAAPVVTTTRRNPLISTTFRTRDDVNFSLYEVTILDTAPATPLVTLEYANMTEAQQLSLVDFYGSRAETSTVYQQTNGKWYILFN